MRINKYTDTITLENNHITRTVYAEYNNKRRKAKGKVPVYMIRDDGTEAANHMLYFCPLGGYLLWNDFSDSDRKWEKPWWKMNSFKTEKSDDFTDEDRETILKASPEFVWTLDKCKYKLRKCDAMNLYIAWLINNKVELLVANKLKHLMLNKSFLKMGKEKQKAILKFINDNPDARYWTLNKILFCIKKKTGEEYDQWRSFRNESGKIVPYKFFKKYGPNIDQYRLWKDYLYMAKQCGHDVKDPYWEYPSDVRKAHDKVSAELDNIKKIEAMARKKAEKERIAKEKKEFLDLAKALSNCKLKTKEMQVSVPQDIESVIKQASKLNQCLVRSNYIGKMANKKCILVFITDDNGTPLATAEILPNGKIGQFYANERAKDIHPTEAQEKALDKWLSKFKAKATDAMKQAA